MINFPPKRWTEVHRRMFQDISSAQECDKTLVQLYWTSIYNYCDYRVSGGFIILSSLWVNRYEAQRHHLSAAHGQDTPLQVHKIHVCIQIGNVFMIKPPKQRTLQIQSIDNFRCYNAVFISSQKSKIQRWLREATQKVHW